MKKLSRTKGLIESGILMFSEDLKYLVETSRDDQKVILWDLQREVKLQEIVSLLDIIATN